MNDTPPGGAGVVNDTVNSRFVVPLSPSATDASLIESDGVAGTSSLVMVPWPTPSATLAPVTPLTVTVTVSSASTIVSPVTLTANVASDEPAGILSDWLSAT